MTTTTAFSDRSGVPGRRKGFSLIEMMISMALMGLVLASIISTFIFFGKSSTSVGTYVDMSRQSRYTLEILAQDIRMAEDVTTTWKKRLDLVMPASMGGDTIQYQYSSQNENLTRKVISGGTVVENEVILDDVELFDFAYYNILGQKTTKLIEAKSVRVDAEMARYVTGLRNTDYIISARFMMRNREVSQ